MLLVFFVAFTVLSVIEVQLLILVAKFLSGTSVILLIIGTGYLGAYLLRNQGRLQIKKFQQKQFSHGVEILIIESILMFIAGIFLICPGLITDMLGVFFLIPLTRHFFALQLNRFIKGALLTKLKKYSQFQVYTEQNKNSKFRQEDIIDID